MHSKRSLQEKRSKRKIIRRPHSIRPCKTADSWLAPLMRRIGMNLKMGYKLGTGSRLKCKSDAVDRHVSRKLRTT